MAKTSIRNTNNTSKNRCLVLNKRNVLEVQIKFLVHLIFRIFSGFIRLEEGGGYLRKPQQNAMVCGFSSNCSDGRYCTFFPVFRLRCWFSETTVPSIREKSVAW